MRDCAANVAAKAQPYDRHAVAVPVHHLRNKERDPASVAGNPLRKHNRMIVTP
jgi:hypothetical protein